MTKAQVRAGAGLAVATAAVLLYGPAHSHSPHEAIPNGQVAQFPGDDDLRREDERLEEGRRAARRRVVEKHAVAVAVVLGDLTLAEGADRFRALAAGDPAALDRLRLRHPGVSDSELWYRNVLAFARAALARHPELGHGPLARLEAEFAVACPARAVAP